jgi:peroxiredoxin
MIKSFFICILLFFFSICFGQKFKAKLRENSVVRDSSGMVYPYAFWKQMLLSGKYKPLALYPENENSDFLIVPLSDDEIETMMKALSKPRPSRVFRDGAKFPAFNETDINGNKYKMKDLLGKVIVINFWFINCAPCRTEIPELNGLVKMYENNEDVVFIGIAMDEKYRLKDFLKTSPFYYNIIENGGYLAKQYNVQQFPTHVVIDGEGKIRFHTIGLARNTVYWINKTIKESVNALHATGITIEMAN